MNPDPQFLGVKDTAKAIGVSHSTVSRYLKRYPHLNHGTVKRQLVNLAEYRAHRSENINIGGAADAAAEARPDPGPAALTAPVADTDSYASQRTRREKAQAQKAELDLARQLGDVVPRAEVEDAGHDAGQLLREALARRVTDLADRLAVMDDPLQIVALIEEQDRAVLVAFADQLTRLDGDPDAVAA